jgi:hypothetical protein
MSGMSPAVHFPTVLERELACRGGEGKSLPENKWQEYQQADVRNWI